MPIKDPKKQRKELFKAVTVMCQFDGMKIAQGAHEVGDYTAST